MEDRDISEIIEEQQPFEAWAEPRPEEPDRSVFEEEEDAADDVQEILDKIWRTVALVGTAWLVFVAVVGGILLSVSA